MGNQKDDCECCDELSPLAKETLNQIELLLSGVQGAISVKAPGFNSAGVPAGINAPGFKVSSQQTEQVDVINTLTELNIELGGQIADILEITQYFYTLNFNNVKPSNLKVDDPNKKVGQFKLKDVTDNPSIDITKFLDFKKFNISKFKKLKISLTVPTIIIEKSIKIGPVSLVIKFMISLVEVTWMAAVHVDYDSIKKALAALKDSATSQKKMVGPAAGKSISELKAIAGKQFAKDPDILAALLPLNSVDNFFKTIKDKGLNLVEEIDIADEAAKIVADDDKTKQLADAKVLADVGVPINNIDKILKDLGTGKAVNVDLGTMELCPVRVPAKPKGPSFTEDDVAAVTQCAVDLKSQEVPELVDTPEIAEIENLISQIPTGEGLIEEMNNFLSEIDSHNKEMQICSKDKEDAKNKLTAYRQATILHDFVHKYTARRYAATRPEALNNLNIALYKERDRLYNVLANQVAYRNYLYSIPNPDNADTNLIYQVNLANWYIGQTQNEITNVTNQFSTSKSNFISSVLNEINTIVPGSSNGKTYDQLLRIIRSKAEAEVNPISNLVGFAEDDISFVLYADPLVLSELKQIESDAKSSGATALFNNYFQANPYTFTPDPTNILSFNLLRTGSIEDVWRKYYSPNRIDLLFTWKEQGYTAPKPVYDDNGKVVSKMVNIEFVNGQGVKTIQEVPQSVKDCAIDIDIAVPFLENLEANTDTKVEQLINEVLNSGPTKSYIDKILSYAELEGKLKYLIFLAPLGFSESVNIFSTNIDGEFAQSYKISEEIYNSLNKKSNITLKTIDTCKSCVAKKQKNIAETGAKFAKVSAVETPCKNGVASVCKKKKGSDPFGIKPSSGECPDQTKNCYWKEYTKLLQTVSLMPIPDVQFLYKRLFRYYPVPLQIPLPVPIPTLASGIPDPLLSIPLPFLWVHLLSIQTPLGLFVMWIGLAGGFMPNPYVMLIDEKGQSSFIFTPKGITPIPARQLAITSPEGKSLLDLIPAFETILKLDLSKFGKLAAGSTRGDSDDPDSAKNVISNIKDKIKKSLDSIEIPDPSWSRENDRAKKAKSKLKKAMEFELPNTAEIPAAIKEAMDGVLKLANEAIDKMEISPYKIPKNSKGMMMELPPFLEIKATADKLISTAKNGPADLVKKIYGDIGKSLVIFDVNKEIDRLVRTEMEKPDIKFKILGINQKIDELESKLTVGPNFDDPENQAALEAKAKAIKERTKIIKELVLIPVQSVADSITPAMLGFLGYADSPLPLPFPCCVNVTLPVVPPAIAAAIALIKSLPSLIKAIPDDAISKLFLNIMDLSASLPAAEELFYMALNPVLGKIPRLVIPTGFKDNLMKQIVKSIKDFIMQFKVRLPKPGLAVQIVIPPEVIKTIIKEAIKIAFGVLIGVILNYVNEILAKTGTEKVAAILALLAIIKLIFGTDLHKVTGKDIKAFISTTVTSAVYPALDALKPIIATATAVKAGFKSIMEMFTIPDPEILLKKEGPFLELDTKAIKKLVDPALTQVIPVIASVLPFPVILLLAATTPGRLALSKIDPRKAIEKLPPWEGLSLKNIPLLLFLDQLAATAQRSAILNSDYVVPYFTPVTP